MLQYIHRFNNYLRIKMTKCIKYPCEYCNKLCYKKFYRAFCSPICKFMGYVEKTDSCWFWKGRKQDDGYGETGVNGKIKMAHRVSYEYFKKPIEKNMLVLHSCNNRACVNPDHLREGTPKDNSIDCIKANRQRKGEEVGNSKLKSEQVLTIRNLYKQGMIQMKIAEKFNVHQTLISVIVRKVRWAHIK